MVLTDNTYIDNTCQKGDQVQYRVRTVTSDGRCSVWSNPVVITVGDNIPPSNPENFQVTSGYAGCLLTWTFPSDDDYAYTEIYRQTVKNGQSVFYDGKIVAGVTGSNFRLINTKKAEESFEVGDFGSIYYFKIRHVDTANNKSDFSPVQRGEVRKLKTKDVAQNEVEKNIYLKPVLGIPTTDIKVRTTDAQGNIIHKNGDNWFYENQNRIYDIQKEVLNTKAQLVSLNQGIENNAAQILTSDTNLRKLIQGNSTSLEDLNNQLNQTAKDLINQLTLSSSALRTDIEKNILALNSTKSTLELIKTDLNSKTTELQTLGQIVENQKQLSTGMLSEIDKNRIKAESLQLALNANLFNDQMQSNLINDLRNQQTNTIEEQTVLSTAIKVINTETEEINRRLTAVDQMLLEGNSERNALEQLINETYSQLSEDFINGQQMATIQNEETYLLVIGLKQRIYNNDLETAQAQREIEALQNRLNDESNLTDAISTKLNDLGLIQKNIITAIDQLRNYDTSIDNRIANIITENQNYRLANNALVQTKIDAESARNIFKEMLKDQTFTDAVKIIINSEFKPLLDSQGQQLQSIQDQVSWLQSNVGTSALVAFAKTISSESNFTTLYNQTQKLASENIQFKTDINQLMNRVGNLEQNISSLITTDSNLQNQLNNLGLADASTAVKINALIDTDSGFRTQINALIAQDAGYQNQFVNYKNAQALVDASQNAVISSNTNRISSLENITNALSAKVSQAVSDLFITSPNFTQDCIYTKTNNAKGMNTININLDVNSGGLVQALNQNFILRQNVSLTVIGKIVGYNQ